MASIRKYNELMINGIDSIKNMREKYTCILVVVSFCNIQFISAVHPAEPLEFNAQGLGCLGKGRWYV